VSWHAGVLLVLALTLIGGFFWFERSRPPAQIVALVGALAAISIAGRIALSPVPNVVPSTDIVLIAGYALGGAPGFAVGALTGLISNFWLGQGPWTPWQMAGWGMTGLLGAWLAAATGGRVGRFGLAAVCALAGLAYGALLDLSLMVTYGGEQSLDRFVALSGRGLPFNVAHAAGNAALALVAGPAMVRMLTRYRRRFEFAWRPATAIPAVLLALLFAGSVSTGDRAGAAASSSATNWLERAQNDDGGFGSAPGEESNPGMTGWAVLGLEAAGINPLDLDRGDATPISFLAGTAGEISTTGDIERTILVLRGAGLDPRRFHGHDLVRRLLARRGRDGSWGGQVNPTAFGIFALRAAGMSAANARSAAWLRSVQNDDGGWGFATGATSDPDTTGAVLQALAAAGSRAGMRAGVRYLRGAQRAGGGFALAGGSVNTQSTAWAVQGLIAAGVSPSSLRSGGRSPLDYLASVKAADGHYRYSTATDQTPVWVTAQALMAVNGKAFPLAPASRRTQAQAGGGSTGAARPSAPTPGASTPGKPVAKPAAPPAAPAEPASADPSPLAPASAGEEGEDGGISALLLGLLIAAVLAAAVWGGWLAYRRRLPD